MRRGRTIPASCRETIFEYPRSPYLPLLTARKISFGDLKSWVSKNGLEDTLRHLEREDVYFTVDEFKGKAPVRRDLLFVFWWMSVAWHLA